MSGFGLVLLLSTWAALAFSVVWLLDWVEDVFGPTPAVLTALCLIGGVILTTLSLVLA